MVKEGPEFLNCFIKGVPPKDEEISVTNKHYAWCLLPSYNESWVNKSVSLSSLGLSAFRGVCTETSGSQVLSQICNQCPVLHQVSAIAASKYNRFKRRLTINNIRVSDGEGPDQGSAYNAAVNNALVYLRKEKGLVLVTPHGIPEENTISIAAGELTPTLADSSTTISILRSRVSAFLDSSTYVKLNVSFGEIYNEDFKKQLVEKTIHELAKGLPGSGKKFVRDGDSIIAWKSRMPRAKEREAVEVKVQTKHRRSEPAMRRTNLNPTARSNIPKPLDYPTPTARSWRPNIPKPLDYPTPVITFTGKQSLVPSKETIENPEGIVWDYNSDWINSLLVSSPYAGRQFRLFSCWTEVPIFLLEISALVSGWCIKFTEKIGVGDQKLVGVSIRNISISDGVGATFEEAKLTSATNAVHFLRANKVTLLGKKVWFEYLARAGDNDPVWELLLTSFADVNTESNRLGIDNIGHVMLTKMGWRDGRAVGKSGLGRTEPIPVKKPFPWIWNIGMGYIEDKARAASGAQVESDSNSTTHVRNTIVATRSSNNSSDRPTYLDCFCLATPSLESESTEDDSIVDSIVVMSDSGLTDLDDEETGDPLESPSDEKTSGVSIDDEAESSDEDSVIIPRFIYDDEDDAQEARVPAPSPEALIRIITSSFGYDGATDETSPSCQSSLSQANSNESETEYYDAIYVNESEHPLKLTINDDSGIHSEQPLDVEFEDEDLLDSLEKALDDLSLDDAETDDIIGNCLSWLGSGYWIPY